MKRHLEFAAAVALAAALAAPAFAEPQPKPTSQPLRVGLNTCAVSWLYVWPDESSLPTIAHMLPSHLGEQFEVIRGPVYTLEGQGLYETTVPVVTNTGSGTHYWISDRCINPAVPKKP